MNAGPEKQPEVLQALLYESVLENAVDGLITIDEAGIVWNYNKACARIFGYPANEVIGRNVSMLMPAPEAARHDGYMKHYHDTGEARIIGIGREVEGRRKDGTLFPMNISVAEVKVGTLKFFSGIVRDATQHRKSEKDQALLAAIIESSDDPIITRTLEGVITSWNKAAERLFGYSADEAIGRGYDLIYPPGRAAEEGGNFAILAGGGRVAGFETVRVAKDGRVIDVSLTLSLVRDAAGKVIGTSRILRDMSGRRKAESDQALLAAIVNTSGDAIISKNLQGVITSWNAAAERLFGYAASEAVGMPVTRLIPADRQDEEKFILSQVQSGKVLDHYETMRVTKSGKEIAVSLTVSAVRDAAGGITGASKILRDISHQKAEEAKLRRANEELEKFAYVAAHDLRAPLRNIDNLASWVIEDNKDSLNADALEKLSLLRERVARLEKLLNDILAYSRAGRVTGKAVEVDVQDLVSHIVQTHVPPGFTVKIPGTLPKLVSPALPLEQIFGNLLANAVRHHDRGGGEIEILSVRRGDFYEFSVRDDGPGIPPEYHARVFEMFQTLKPRDQVDGSGMGMAIIKKLVEWQGGRCWISSETGKRGTTVLFLWPAEVHIAPASGEGGKVA